MQSLCSDLSLLEPPGESYPRVAQCHHDLRSDHDSNSRTYNQYDTGSDVMQVARAFVPIAPSGPSSHDPCRCPHVQKNSSGIDRDNHEAHAAETRPPSSICEVVDA